MNLVRRLSSVSDRTLRRLTRAGLAVLVIGVPAFAAFYYMDQHVDSGPSLIDRKVQLQEQLVVKKPRDLTLRLGLAQAYTQTGRTADALKQYAEILKVEPQHRLALLGRGDLLRQAGDLAGAEAMYAKLIGPALKGEFAGADSALSSALFGMAAIREAQGRPKQAVIMLGKVLAIDSTDADGWYLLGSAELKAGAPARAVAAFRRATLFVPAGWCEPYGGMASAYRALGKTAQARYAGAMTDFCQGRQDRARDELATLTSGPAALDAMVGSGLVAETQSDRAAAAGWYRKALKRDPTNFLALSGLYRLGERTPAGSPRPAH